MNGFLAAANAMSSFLLTYLIHSTAIIVAFALLTRLMRGARRSELRVLAWKLALVLPFLTTFAITILPFPHRGVQLALSDSQATQTESKLTVPSAPARRQVTEVAPTIVSSQAEFDTDAEEPLLHEESFTPLAATPRIDQSWTWASFTIVWILAAILGFITLTVQLVRLHRLRANAKPISEPALCAVLAGISERMSFSRPVALLQSPDAEGPITAGILKPYILFPTGLNLTDQPAERNGGCPSSSEIEAVFAHEIAHIIHRDTLWNLIAQLIVRAFPIQPLHRWVARQLRVEMDIAADLYAVRTLHDRRGLIQCLLRLGQRMTFSETGPVTKAGLAAGMVALRSTLGQRIEILLNERETLSPSPRSLKYRLLIVMTSGAMLAASFLPRAVAKSTPTRNTTMKDHLATLAVLIGLTAPTAAHAIQDQPAVTSKSIDLKTTPDPLPDGIRNFNGMLLGRLAAKDVEKGTFVVFVDAVPRVWRNSRAENPKCIVGSTVEVSGVFGKFLDVLVVTRKGETLEFECKYDDDKLVFPGEMLRKTAPYKPEDYPVLPEEFRGFRGTVNAEIVRKDPETFELIVKVHKVIGKGDGNSAKDPESIEGKNLMLAGFWNRKDAYHNLKVGDRIEAGMQHIAKRSDHLNVGEFVRKSGESAEPEPERRETESDEGGLARELRGFRGMLVGTLVEKDIERGTFTIKVDAVPRVWNNNKSSNPKAFIGRNADAEGVHGKLLDALVVTRVGETIQFGALHEEGSRLRVGEVLRKVSPVKKGDYPELPDGFRGFKGMLVGKVLKKDDQLLDMVIEVKSVDQSFEGSRANQAESIIGKQAMLTGFWRRKEVFHSIEVGDTIRCGVEHPQRLSDHLSVIESVKKVEE